MQEEQKNTEQQLETAPEQKKKSRLLMIGLEAAVVAVVSEPARPFSFSRRIPKR